MIEVELKAFVCKDDEKGFLLKEKIDNLYGSGKTVNKVDQYFNRAGDVRQALRMRDNNGTLEFTAKNTSHNKLGELNKEYEFSTTMDQYDKAYDFFICLGYVPYFKKIKNGWDWFADDIHIELLEVSGSYKEKEISLGYFLEMEILIPFKKANIDEREEYNKLYNLLKRFGLNPESVCSSSYRSMIIGEN